MVNEKQILADIKPQEGSLSKSRPTDQQFNFYDISGNNNAAADLINKMVEATIKLINDNLFDKFRYHLKLNDRKEHFPDIILQIETFQWVFEWTTGYQDDQKNVKKQMRDLRGTLHRG
ncbi:hypothetical protein Tcan_17229 [Toxocara canis]|uniref:Uncharacterized protein n=1 Tax=Toxocara canis TaxID=6265 RepID=A0A0B2UY26_TOXCA|nr:hypothetical protein Tcan_17229 [Toxocara canis]